eukprot:469491_1
MGSKLSKQNEIKKSVALSLAQFSIVVSYLYRKLCINLINRNNMQQYIIDIMFTYYPLIDSMIITQYNQLKILYNWIKERRLCGNKLDFKLCYRASMNGFSAKAFQNKCCDKEMWSLVLIETIEGHIIGGFTTIVWSLNNSSMNTDPFAFTFLLHCNDAQYNYKPQIYGAVKSKGCWLQTSTSVQEGTGPNFSGASNVYVINCQSNSNGMDVAIYFGKTPGFQNAQFEIKEYEVFEVRNYRSAQLSVTD